MVEKDKEGEEEALVNNSGEELAQASTGNGGVTGQGEKKGESKGPCSCCCASFGAIWCRGHGRKDNKGKYDAVCHFIVFYTRWDVIGFCL